MRRILYAVLLLHSLAGLSGCRTVVKRAVKEVRGAQSEVEMVPGTVSGNFDRFQGVRVTPPRTELGALVPPGFGSALQMFLSEFLSQGESAPFAGGNPVLQIDPHVHWFHRPGGLGSILGSDSYAVVLFYLTENGSELGRLQVVTKNAAMHVKEEGMAESAAKELAKWFTKIRENGLPED